MRDSQNLSETVTVNQESDNEFAVFSEQDGNLEHIRDVKAERMEIRELGFRLNWKEHFRCNNCNSSPRYSEFLKHVNLMKHDSHKEIRLNVKCEFFENVTSKKISLPFVGKPADHLNELLNTKCEIDECRCTRNLLDVDFI